MTNAEAIEHLKNIIIFSFQDGYTAEAREALRMAIKALEESRWIPVKEKKPKKDGSYLISGKWSDGKEAVGECEYLRDDGYFMTSWNFDVIAWKPLPEPYREDGD
jgi:sigma54-dependent transcription regulator